MCIKKKKVENIAVWQRLKISYIDEEIVTGKIYTYAVRAYIGEDRSTYTGVVCPSIEKPIVEVKDSNGGVEVSWNEIDGAEGYYVYRKEEGGRYTLLQKLENVGMTSYLDNDLSVGTKYVYAVRDYLGKYRSSFSAVDITADLGRVTVSLEASDSAVQLVWNEIVTAEGYYIYRKADGEEEYTLINTIDDASIVSYTDQQVDDGKTYYYTVRAFFGEEQSSYAGGAITME